MEDKGLQPGGAAMNDATSSSASEPAAGATRRSTRLALWALLVGNLVIGTGFMMPIGILHLIAASMSVSVSQAGALMWAGGIVLAIGAPTMAWMTSRFDRRGLLVAALLVYTVGHALSALVDDFALLLGLRLATLGGAAIFTAQAAATVGLILPPDKRASAIAFVFTGWSIAAAVAVPLTSWVGAQAGWAVAFWMVAAGCGAALVLVAMALPGGLRVPPVSLRTWVDVARDPVLPVILAVTVLQMTGGFTLYTFIAPEIGRRLYPSPTLIAALLACFGIAGVIGSIVASRIANRVSPNRLVLVGLGIAATGLLTLAIAPRLLAFYVVGLFLWGFAGFPVQSSQQARLISARPPLASATAALNSSAIYLGQAFGGGLGASIIAIGNPDALVWLGAVLLVAAMGVSVLADRRAANAGGS
jgi:predicted MFS family arabinose efflux permease